MKLRGKKATEILGQTVLWVILIASLLIFSVPFFFMITNSFEEFSYVLPYPPKLFPTRLDFRRTGTFSVWTFSRRHWQTV